MRLRAPNISFFPPLGGGIEGGSRTIRQGGQETPSNSPFARGRVLLGALKAVGGSYRWLCLPLILGCADDPRTATPSPLEAGPLVLETPKPATPVPVPARPKISPTPVKAVRAY